MALMFGDMTHGNNTRLSFASESNMSMSIHEDTGFCSGEDYMEHEIHSPTDTSEDSVEVKVSAITYSSKKRKLLLAEEPRTTYSGPLKKRMCQKVKAEAKTPFRPWSPTKSTFAVPCSPLKPATESRPFAYFRPPSPQQQPVSLVIKREKDEQEASDVRVHPHITRLSSAETERTIIKTHGQFKAERKRESLVIKREKDEQEASDVRVPVHPHITHLSSAETESMINKTNEQFPGLTPEMKKAEQKREQRNYKNMTRERRIEANARERTRVHTISAAFDSLRQAVPSYSHNQKLSKLSVLRIACSYIMTLSSLVQEDEDSGKSEASTSECVDMVSRTIQREGKLRKKKDDND